MNKYILDIYISNAMEIGLRPLSFMEFLQNYNHLAVNKINFVNCLMIVVLKKKKLHETLGSQSKFHEFNIYI